MLREIHALSRIKEYESFNLSDIKDNQEESA